MPLPLSTLPTTSPLCFLLSYLTNVASNLCLNSDDCGTELIAFTCVTSGGTCCGADCYDNLVFALQADGSLTTPSQPGMCVTYQVRSVLRALLRDLRLSGPPPPL